MFDVILIGGENPVFIKEELDKAIHSFSDYDKSVYYGDELRVEDFFSDLNTGSLFFNHRVLVVRNAEKSVSDFEKRLLEYLKNPPGNVTLILEYQKIPAKILNTTEELGNKRAKIHNFKKPWAQDQKNYIQRRFSDKGITVHHSLFDLLISYAGEDIQELSGMLDKLLAFIGNDKTTIDEHDIHNVLERVQNSSIFDLTDAVFTHNKARALQSLNDLLYSGESYPAIVAMFYRATKIMWAVKTSKNGQMPQGLSVSPYEWKKYQGFALKNNLRFLSSCFECIQNMEIESKTKPELFVRMTFEQFLCDL